MILAVDSSGRAASVGLLSDGILKYEIYSDMGLTHSRTLAPMIAAVLSAGSLSPQDISLFAAAAGPGSFTGLRIGIAAVKAMAWAAGKPCAGVSSLEGMAWNHLASERTILSVMDARAGRVYGAFFESDGEKIIRRTDDKIFFFDELAKETKDRGAKLLLVGDGAGLCYNILRENGADVKIAPANGLYQRAFGVGRAGEEAAKAGKTILPEALSPVYLAKPQAERERLKKLEERTL